MSSTDADLGAQSEAHRQETTRQWEFRAAEVQVAFFQEAETVETNNDAANAREYRIMGNVVPGWIAAQLEEGEAGDDMYVPISPTQSQALQGLRTHNSSTDDEGNTRQVITPLAVEGVNIYEIRIRASMGKEFITTQRYIQVNLEPLPGLEVRFPAHPVPPLPHRVGA